MFLQHRENFLQIFSVLRKQIFLIEIPAHPRPAKRPERPVCQSCSRRCLSPQIHVVKTRRTFTVKILLCRLLRIFQQFPIHPHQRLRQFMKITGTGHPVVHLCIDIYRIIALPGRDPIAVPDSLQICRLCPRPRTGNQQIPPIVKQQLLQSRILAVFFILFQPFRKIHSVSAAISKRQFHSLKILLILSNMFLPQLFYRHSGAFLILKQKFCRIISLHIRMSGNTCKTGTNQDSKGNFMDIDASNSRFCRDDFSVFRLKQTPALIWHPFFLWIF